MTFDPSPSRRVRRIPRGLGGGFGASLALVATGLIALVALPDSPLNLAAAMYDHSGTSLSIHTDSRADFTRLEGRWKARFSGDRVRLRLKVSQPGIRWEFSATLRKSDLGLASDGTYELRRDAGAFRLEGLQELSGSVSGDFGFVADPEFADSLVALGHDDIDSEMQFRLAVLDVRLGFIEMLAHYNGEIDLAGVIRLCNHGIDEDYVLGLEDAAYAGLSATELIRLRNHGVSADYARRMAEAGFGVPPVDDLISLRNHGVGAEFLGGLARVGYEDAAVEDVIRLKNHGISPGYLGELAESGLEDPSLDDVIRLRNHGVRADYLRRLTQTGGGLSVDHVILLNNHGASPELFEAFATAGLDPPSPEEVVRLHTRGIGPDYVQDLVDAGLEDLSVEQMVQLRNHGIRADYVGEVLAAADRRYSPEELVRLQARGVRGDFVRRMAREGQTDLSADRLIRLREDGPSRRVR